MANLQGFMTENQAKDTNQIGTGSHFVATKFWSHLDRWNTWNTSPWICHDLPLVVFQSFSPFLGFFQGFDRKPAEIRRIDVFL